MVHIAALCEDHTLESLHRLHGEGILDIVTILLPLADDGVSGTSLVSSLLDFLYLPIFDDSLISNEDVGSLEVVEILLGTWRRRFNLEMHVAVNLEGEVTTLDNSLTAACKQQSGDSDKEQFSFHILN